MKVLWVCNLVLPEFSTEYNIKASNFGGWMSGLLGLLKGVPGISLDIAVPIYDKSKRYNFEKNGIDVYSFDGQMDRSSPSDDYVAEFESIIKDSLPDVIHIWGTEYNHAYYAVIAARKLGLINRVLIDIQGLTTFIAMHFLDGIPQDVIDDELNCNHSRNLLWERSHYCDQGEVEKKIITTVYNATGRTKWDFTCVRQLNSKIEYYHNDRVLRAEFYNNVGEWNDGECVRYTIFISSAAYALKGFHVFIKAIEILAKKFDGLKVIVAGENPINQNKEGISQYGAYLNNLIEKAGISKYIEFCGVLCEQEMIEEMKRANVFVACSTVENSCNSLCEAMMIGTPVVAAYSGGIPSLIRDGYDGFLYQTNAPYMAASCIENIFLDHALADKLSKNAIKTAIERHDREKITERMCSIYRKIYDDGINTN